MSQGANHLRAFRQQFPAQVFEDAYIVDGFLALPPKSSHPGSKAGKFL
jgi:hypothetical protein